MGLGGFSTSKIKCGKCRSTCDYGAMLRKENKQCEYCYEYYNTTA